MTDLVLFDDRQTYRLTDIRAKLDHSTERATMQWIRDHEIPRFPVGKGKWAFSGRLLNEAITNRSQTPREDELG